MLTKPATKFLLPDDMCKLSAYSKTEVTTFIGRWKNFWLCLVLVGLFSLEEFRWALEKFAENVIKQYTFNSLEVALF